jgi:hypothetical protein
MTKVFWSITKCVLILIASAVAQKEAFVPSNDVSFTLTTEKTTYKAGEQIDLKYEILNIGNAALYVPRQWDGQCPHTLHIWAWFENSAGQHFIPGYGGSCASNTSPSSRPRQTLPERIEKGAALLRPGQRLEGTIRMDTTLFGGLKPGEYRLESTLSGWSENNFTPAQQLELSKMGAPFMRGEVPASTPVTLIP